MNALTTSMQRDFERADPALSDLEWKVVAIALREAGDGCGVRPADRGGALARFWRAVTGFEPRRPLADPRLETLRRFVCTARRRRDEATALAARLIDMGFSRRQLDAVTLLARR